MIAKHIVSHFEGFFFWGGGRDFSTPKIVLSAARGNLGGQKNRGPIEKPPEMANHLFRKHTGNKITYILRTCSCSLVILCPSAIKFL